MEDLNKPEKSDVNGRILTILNESLKLNHIWPQTSLAITIGMLAEFCENPVPISSFIKLYHDEVLLESYMGKHIQGYIAGHKSANLPIAPDGVSRLVGNYSGMVAMAATFLLHTVCADPREDLKQEEVLHLMNKVDSVYLYQGSNPIRLTVGAIFDGLVGLIKKDTNCISLSKEYRERLKTPNFLEDRIIYPTMLVDILLSQLPIEEGLNLNSEQLKEFLQSQTLKWVYDDPE